MPNNSYHFYGNKNLHILKDSLENVTHSILSFIITTMMITIILSFHDHFYTLNRLSSLRHTTHCYHIHIMNEVNQLGKFHDFSSKVYYFFGVIIIIHILRADFEPNILSIKACQTIIHRNMSPTSYIHTAILKPISYPLDVIGLKSTVLTSMTY